MTKKLFFILLIAILSVFVLAACDIIPLDTDNTTDINQNNNFYNADNTTSGQEYTLTFYEQDGKTVVTTMEVSNKRISVPDAPKVEGYTFVGWYLDRPDSSLKVDSEFFMRNNASQDRVAYPKYHRNYSALNFFVDGYRVSTLQIADEVIQLPKAPSKDHYIFEGWYLTFADSGVELTTDYFVSHPAEGYVEAHAKFTRVEYTLTFVANGKVVDTIKVSDKEIELPDAPAPEYNLVFIGWYIENYKLPINSDYFVRNPATGNVTVEAKYISSFEVLPTGLDTCTITGYIGNDNAIRIPDKIIVSIDGRPIIYEITAIDQGAFANKKIKSIIIGPNVQFIEDNAFFNCTSLETINISSSVTYISNTAFEGCTSVTSLTIDEENPIYRAEDNKIIRKDNGEVVFDFNIYEEN